MKQILLNPGPVNLSERVRAALLRPDLCHREGEFGDLQDAVRAGLLAVYGLDAAAWRPVLVAGSGTAAVEAMLASCVPADGRLLVLENGVYGERMRAIAAAHGIAVHALSHGLGERLDVARLEAALAADPAITHIAVVHHETTTGRLNDLEKVAEAAARAGAALLVDAVSSFGGEAIALDGIAALAGTANKCLHGVPGISFVLARAATLASAAQPPRSVYLDLRALAQAQDRRSTAFTMPVQVLYALDEALQELRDEGGWRARHASYAARSEQVAAGLRCLGLEPWLPAGASSVVLTTWHLPAGVDYTALHDALKERGFVIYAGQGRLAREAFRVSTMGALDARDLERFVAAVGEVLARR